MREYIQQQNRLQPSELPIVEAETYGDLPRPHGGVPFANLKLR